MTDRMGNNRALAFVRWILALPLGMVGGVLLGIIIWGLCYLIESRVQGGGVARHPISRAIGNDFGWGALSLAIATLVAPRPMGRASLVLASAWVVASGVEGVVYHLRGLTWNYAAVLWGAAGAVALGLLIAFMDRHGWLSARLRI